MSELSSNQNSNVTEDSKQSSQTLTGSRKGRFFFKKQKCDITNPSADKQKTANKNGSDGNPSECSHQIIIKDMCGTCGKDLRIKGGFSGERIAPSVANVSMIHHVPELVVSNEIANELGARDHQNVLRQRKLILLVDLDQTLVHTSNRPPKPNEAGATDMFGYQIYGAMFFTKIRPYTRHLLESLNKLYEMHIVTYGQRIYAHKIAELLDPNKVYFGYRILSRDELLSSMHKTGNLKALFPCSEQLVVMLDDRPDVWMHSEALIRVKPYRFFNEIGDINAPTEQELQQIKDPAVNKCLKDEEEMVQSTDAKQAGANDKVVIQHEKIKDASDSVDAEKVKDIVQRGLEARTGNESSNDDLSLPFPQLQDEDCALEHIERILSEVHSLFYQQYDRDNNDESKKENVPDIKRIVAWLRSQVLAGERIVFSGIVPIGIDIRNCEIHRLCTKFGAIVEDKIVEGQTTVLVAARAFTEKTRQARNLKIPVVSTRWLDACFERWQKVDKLDFLFDEEERLLSTAADEKPSIEADQREIASGKRFSRDDVHSAASLSNKRSRHSESLCLDEETDHFGQMDTLDKRALHEMEDEVANALLEEDDSTDEEEDS